MATRRAFLAGMLFGGVGGAAGMGAIRTSERDNGNGPWNEVAGSGDDASPPLDGLATELRKLTNEKRFSIYGGVVEALTLSDSLNKLALYHSDFMAEQSEVSHSSAENESLAQRYQKFNLIQRLEDEELNRIENGYECIGKAPYKGMTADEVAAALFSSWQETKKSNEALVYRGWSHHGIGVSAGPEYVYATQNFW